jgi:hypothetical protein
MVDDNNSNRIHHIDVNTMHYLVLDVVIFESHYNPKLYSNLIKYIQIYQDYFTTKEWSYVMPIDDNDDNHNNNNNGTNIDVRQGSIYDHGPIYDSVWIIDMGIDFQSFEQKQEKR